MIYYFLFSEQIKLKIAHLRKVLMHAPSVQGHPTKY